MNNHLTKKDVIIEIIFGLLIGFINGFFGGGGGMIVIPVLLFLIGLEDKKAHASAILIILPISICSSVVYLINNVVLLDKQAFTGIGFVIGGIIGALILSKINNKALRVIFSIVMIIAGIKMLF